MYRIMMTEDGGPEGYGQSWVKKNGKIRVFESRREAEEAAVKMRKANRKRASRVKFSFGVATC